MPESSQRLSRGLRQWRVKDKLFVWERPLRRTEIDGLGERAADGPILAARVEHIGAKEALLADDPHVYSRPRTSTAIRPCWRGFSSSRQRISASSSPRPGWHARRSRS